MDLGKPSGHEDSFARDNLPPAEEWPEAAGSTGSTIGMVDIARTHEEMVEKGFGDRTALIATAPPHLQGTHRLDQRMARPRWWRITSLRPGHRC